MTQTRDRERKAPVDSYLLNRKFQGILYHGRYQGFDTIKSVSGLNFAIGHDGSAHKNYSRDTFTATNNLGIWTTRQGVTVQEDADISGLSCLTNAANAFQRIDILVGSHQYSDSVTGGNAATYSIIKGADGGPVIPTTASNNQVVLGYIYIPASAANLSAATYIPAEVLGLGGQRVAKLDLINRFLSNQQWNEVSSAFEIVNTSALGGARDRQIAQLTLPLAANSYYIQKNIAAPGTYYTLQGLPRAEAGTIITIHALESGIRLQSYQMNSAERSAGYMPLELPWDIDNGQAYDLITLGDQDSVILQSTLSPSAGLVWKALSINSIMGKAYRAPIRETGDNILNRLIAVALHTDMDGNAANAYYYKDQFNRVYFAGEPIKCTSTFNINTTMFTLPSGYKPLNSGNHAGDVYAAAPVQNVVSSYSPPKMCTIVIKTTGEVKCSDYQFQVDDFVDLRTISFLAED